MQDTFQWTTELVNEYAGTFLLQAMKAIEAARNGSTVEKIISASEFIASKAPKKEWEIVAYSFEPLKGIDKPVLVTQGSKYWERAISGDKDFLIHSVRRLSDASEWHVKEKVEVWETGRFTIQSFEISAGQMLVKTDGGTYLLNALQKLPQPILTRDGAKISNPETEIWVLEEDTIGHFYAEQAMKDTDRFKGMQIFSTREAAEKYILDQDYKYWIITDEDLKPMAWSGEQLCYCTSEEWEDDHHAIVPYTLKSARTAIRKSNEFRKANNFTPVNHRLMPIKLY